MAGTAGNGTVVKLETPYYLIDERRLQKNLALIRNVCDLSGAKAVLALKCFSAWSVFGLMRRYLDGTTSSSLYEARLGYEKFGKEVHSYAVAYTRPELEAVSRFSDKIIFNSVSQLERFARYTGNCRLGLRINPRVSYSHFDLADPARKYSRLGVVSLSAVRQVLDRISGVMFHFNCENDDVANFAGNLAHIGRRYGSILKRLQWVSLGGGLYFTKAGYPHEQFVRLLKEFSDRFQVQVYLEPGESVITQSAELVTTVLDIVRNTVDIAVVDASIEAHMLDLLIYRIEAKLAASGSGSHTYIIAGRSCLAGDIFGTYRLPDKLRVGSRVVFGDAAGYTMVKKNWFNGVRMPSIVVRRLNGRVDLVRRFTYEDFVGSLS